MLLIHAAVVDLVKDILEGSRDGVGSYVDGHEVVFVEGVGSTLVIVETDVDHTDIVVDLRDEYVAISELDSLFERIDLVL